MTLQKHPLCKTILLPLLFIASLSELNALEWPTYEFVIVKAEPNELVVYGGASGEEFPAERAVAVKRMEDYLKKVAVYYQSLGFDEPVLEQISGRNNQPSYLIRLNDYDDTQTHARYATDFGYIEADLSRVFVGNAASDKAMESLGHELFHAVQRAYLNSDNLSHGLWITEGQAEAIGIDTARELAGIDIYKGDNDDYRLGGRQYFSPLPTETKDETYRTASFWRYLAEIHARAGAKPKTDYSYLTRFYEVPFGGPSGTTADLKWLEKGIQAVFKKDLAEAYSQFISAFADYVPSRLTKELEGTEQQAKDKWLNRLFDRCDNQTLSSSNPDSSVSLMLRKMASRCFKVTVENAVQNINKPASSGSDFLRRVKGKNKASKTDLAIQVRGESRNQLEALWMGAIGEKEMTQAYVGRDRQGYVGYWSLNMNKGETQAFVVSNVAEDASLSKHQDLTFHLHTSAASMSSSGNMGDVGGPINLSFDQFPLRDVLSTQSEVQIKAGIKQPCMLRMRMKESTSQADFSLLMDHDGPLQPGSFQASGAKNSEDAPGQFLAAVSFGRGRDRVSYQAESGTMDLTHFSPNLLQGTISIMGKLPPKVYGQKPSTWPGTIAIKTEFSLVPRVNLSSSMNKNNYCFQSIGDL